MQTNSVLKNFKSFFDGGDERTAKARKNIIYMFFLRGGSIFISLLLVPLTLDYVDSFTYGVWLTLSTMVAWIRLFDIGINNGLKNKLAESLALGELEQARTYVSTTYAMLSMVFIPLMLILLIIIPFFNWQSILNTPEVDSISFNLSLYIIIIYFCFNFILSTINVVLYADQKPADVAFRNFIQQVVSLLSIYLLTITTEGSLIKLCAGLCMPPLLVVLYFNFSLYRKRYKLLTPSLKYVDFTKAKSLLNMGIKFFIIQICFIIQYHMANFLIIRYYGAEEVTVYNISYKYFNALYTIWNIMMAPVWVAVTDAVTKGELDWVRNLINKYLRIFVLFCIIFIVMLFLSNYIYHLWVGDKVIVPFVVSFWIMVYNIIMCLGSIFTLVLNGAGVLKVQTVFSVIAPFIFILSFLMLYNFGVGVISIPIASISTCPGMLIAILQCKYIFYDKKKGTNILYK